MANLWLPPQSDIALALREPVLVRGNTQALPASQVELDPTHWAYKHCIAGVLPNQSNKGLGSLDRSMTYNLFTNARMSNGGVLCDGDLDCYRSSSALSFDPTDATSLIVLNYKKTVTESFNYLAYCQSFTNFSVYFDPSGDLLLSGVNSNQQCAIDDGEWHTIAVVQFEKKGTVRQDIFVAVDGRVTIPTTSMSSSLKPANDNFCWNGRDDSTGRSGGGILRLGLLYLFKDGDPWDSSQFRSPSIPSILQQLAIDMSANPFATSFRPANSTPYLISVPTGGATVTLSSPTATVTSSTTATVGCTVTYT